MFSLTVFIQKSDGTPTDGVLSVYDTSNVLVARESSIDGAVRVDLLFNGRALVKIASDGQVFQTYAADIDVAGEGELTISALPVPVRTPIGSDWCSVRGSFRSVVGTAPRVTFHVTLVSGDYRAQDATIYNQPQLVTSEENGSFHTQLLRGRRYELVYAETPYDELGSYTVYVPNREHADLYDLLYPHAVAGFINQPFTGSGDYLLTLLLSDGREVTAYSEMQKYIYSVEADNAEVTFTASEQGSGLLTVAGQPGALVRVTGNRRGDINIGPVETLGVLGDVFLTLVS
jgi:hypothetical protein